MYLFTCVYIYKICMQCILNLWVHSYMLMRKYYVQIFYSMYDLVSKYAHVCSNMYYVLTCAVSVQYMYYALIRTDTLYINICTIP